VCALAAEAMSDADRAALSLGPIRRRVLLALAQQPDSATGLARRLGLPRQKVNYHVRELERAGLVELHDLRQRRGLVERRLRTRPELQDAFSSAYQVQAAAKLIREVTVQRDAAGAAQQRLATLTLEIDISIESPRAFREFSADLQRALADLARRYHHIDGRPYRVLVASHPKPRQPEATPA
jgi:DNA-binding transcriptional ArsR family regulator